MTGKQLRSQCAISGYSTARTKDMSNYADGTGYERRKRSDQAHMRDAVRSKTVAQQQRNGKVIPGDSNAISVYSFAISY